ncbi:MAG TPA: aspartate kinase [Planctomycetia bacterium]|nr:aspartate kinase [Planctomycetia bacterium]
MGVVVMKFGGTSVATPEKIRSAARRAIDARRAGHHVAVVVSARGHTTDHLVELAKQINPDPPARELDMLMSIGEQESIALLAMAIHALGVEAVSLTGGQMGIETDSIHGKARIQKIRTDRVQQVFERNDVAIVAGFQGIDVDNNVTTLGRGGSDTTAVAIAAALGADVCEIFTDVDGVFTTDPRQEPSARKIEQISYDEMLELASVGAGVMHSRSIEFAKKFGVVIHVRNSGHENPGTIIRPESPEMEHIPVRGAALVINEARVTMRDVPDQPGVVHQIFAAIAAEHVVVDMIVQNIALAGKTEVSFTVPESDLPRTLEIAKRIAAEIGAGAVDHSNAVAKVSVVGLGMRTHSGVADRMFTALAALGVNIHMISTSEIKISALVDRDRGLDALQAVHREFSLHEALPEYREDPRFPARARSGNGGRDSEDRLRQIARSLPTMEEIVVSDVEIDDNQGRVTLYGVPDRPGVSAAVFKEVAAAGIAVDMIVQSVGADGGTHLSFTTALRSDLAAAAEQARKALGDLGEGQIAADGEMAKLAVRGVGMRSHSSVAVRMFRALAARGINIQLINTSELHLAVVVRKEDGAAALAALRLEFGVEPPKAGG